MPVGDAKLRVRAIVAIVSKHHRGNSRRVGLERERQQVVHQIHVIADFGRNTGRCVDVRIGNRAKALGMLDPLLDVADAA